MEIPKKIADIIGKRQYRLDQVGLSGAGIYMFDDMVLKIQPESEESKNELQMMHWLYGKIPVPSVIEHLCENNCSYLLMSKCSGKMSCDEEYMQDPVRQVDLLASTLHMLWDVPTMDCPCQWSLARRLAVATKNVAAGNVDIANSQPNTFGEGGFKNPEELLKWLITNKPEETQSLTHGDFCLPNIFLERNRLTGLIDLGRSGIAGPWQDIALCLRSLTNNYGGMYNRRTYPGFKNDMLFDALGIQPDWERIRYYILLDELF